MCGFAKCAVGRVEDNPHDFCEMAESVDDGFQTLQGKITETVTCFQYYKKEKEYTAGKSRKTCKKLKEEQNKEEIWFPVIRNKPVHVWCKDNKCRCIDPFGGNLGGKTCCQFFNETGLETISS